MLPLIVRIKFRLQAINKKVLKKLRRFKPQITKEQLLNDLAAAGINKGDILIVYSSLSKIGNVKGGAQTVISALLEALGNEGTLVMPTFSYLGTMENTARVKEYVYDPLTTPSCVGLIAETFRKMPGVLRSIHPTHSVSAIGPLAKVITEGHLKAKTNFGQDTPFDMLMQYNAKALGLGVGIAYPTFYHSAEDFNPHLFGPVYLPDIKPIKVRTNGKEQVKSIYVHDPAFHKKRIDKNADIEKWMMNHLHKKGLLHIANFGGGKMWWIDAKQLYDEVIFLVKKNISIYDVPETDT
jgi:aminoglycoside 3-N-acetyltransferase